MVKTEEDVKITDSYNKMIEKYSNNYVREENMYTYICTTYKIRDLPEVYSLNRQN